MEDKKYYFIIFKDAKGFTRWTKFSSELGLNVFLKDLEDSDVSLITYVSKIPEDYLDAVRQSNNDGEKVTKWNVSVAKKTIKK